MHVIFIAGIKTIAVCCCFWEVLLHAGLCTLAECQERGHKLPLVSQGVYPVLAAFGV